MTSTWFSTIAPKISCPPLGDDRIATCQAMHMQQRIHLLVIQDDVMLSHISHIQLPIVYNSILSSSPTTPSTKRFNHLPNLTAAFAILNSTIGTAPTAYPFSPKSVPLVACS
jgi:hypothetical protein